MRLGGSILTNFGWRKTTVTAVNHVVHKTVTVRLNLYTRGFTISIGHRRVGWFTFRRRGIRSTLDTGLPGLCLFESQRWEEIGPRTRRRRTNSDALAKLGAPLGVALPRPGRVDQDKMECVNFPKGCHRHSASARTVPCPRPTQRLTTCAAARHNFRSISRGIHLLTASLLRVAGGSVFGTSCDTGISRIPSSWPLASARLNARHACQKQR